MCFQCLFKQTHIHMNQCFQARHCRIYSSTRPVYWDHILSLSMVQDQCVSTRHGQIYFITQSGTRQVGLKQTMLNIIYKSGTRSICREKSMSCIQFSLVQGQNIQVCQCWLYFISQSGTRPVSLDQILLDIFHNFVWQKANMLNDNPAQQ